MIKKIRTLNKIELIALVFILISFFNFGYFMYHNVIIQSYKLDTCCEMADETEEDRLRKKELREEAEIEIPRHEKILEQSKPICTGIGIISILVLLPLFIYGMKKKYNYVINIFMMIAVLFSTFFVLALL